MPQIPRLTGTQIAPRAAAQPRMPFTPNQGLEDLASGATRAAGVLGEIRLEEKRKADRAAVIDAQTRLDQAETDLSFNPETGAYARAGKNAFGLPGQYLPEYDKRAGEISDTLTSPTQKALFREVAMERRARFDRNLNVHESREREKYYDATDDAALQNSMSMAGSYYTQPDRVQYEVANQAAILKNTAARKGWSDEELQQKLSETRTNTYTDVIGRYLANDKPGEAKRYLDSVRDQVSGTVLGKLDNAINDGIARVQAKQRAAAITSQANSILQAFQAGGPDNGTAALESLRKSGLSLETQADVYSKVQSGLNLMRNQQQEAHADDLASIQTALAKGTAGQDQLTLIDELWNQNVFTPNERASLIARVEGVHVQHAGDQAQAQVVQQALESGTPLDPSNSQHRKALAAAFGEVSRETPVGSAPWQGLASAYASRTRMLPDQAVSWVRSAIRSPDPKVAAPAAEFLGSIASTAPDALSSVDSDTRAFAGTVSSMIAAGTDPTRAVETARQNILEANPAVIESRRKAYSTGKNAFALQSNSALDSYIDRDFDTLFTAQPTASEAMRVDFNAQAQRYYEKTGDIQSARDLAWQDLKRVYGVTEVNGTKQMMALPPERFGVSAESVRQDISAFLSSNNQSENTNSEDIAVVPDGLTMRSVADILDGKAQMPSYKLVNTKTGDLVVNAKGIPVRYTLPTQEDLTAKLRDEQAQAQARAKQQIDQARFDRDSRRKILKGGSGPGVLR